ncbi:hypothetical protein AK812_SmicGene46185, partial [Symbiodinium microadriaticum]
CERLQRHGADQPPGGLLSSGLRRCGARLPQQRNSQEYPHRRQRSRWLYLRRGGAGHTADLRLRRRICHGREERERSA